MAETVIQVRDLSKQYRLGVSNTGTISHDLNRWWARTRGKEDPYAKIGEVNDRTTKGLSDYVWALKGVDFEVMQGEVLGIIGRNGAGKSTLLKLLSKVTRPTTGSIKMKGRVASLLEVGTGFHPELTGRENVFLNGAILGMTKAEIKGKFNEIVEFAGVERYIDTPVKRYSSGMYVRLAFAVAAHLEPEILIVDEVLAVGDAEFQKRCLGKMDEVSKEEGRTILFVSHNMNAVRQLCSKSILLKNGVMAFNGQTEDALRLYLSHEKTDYSISTVRFPPNDRKFQIVQASLWNNQGDNKNIFDSSEEINITLHIRVQEEIRGLYGYVTIHKMDGMLLMEADNTEIGENILANLEQGDYTVSIKLPAHILGKGDYTFYVNFASKLSGNAQNYTLPQGSLIFMVKEDQSERGKTRRALLSTQPRWSIISEENKKRYVG